MKELEALEIVLHTSLWDCYNDEPHEWTKKETEAYELLKKSLTPPTSEEVCKALGEYLCEKIGKKLEVEYLNGDFILQNNYIAFLDGKGSLCFNFNLPPHLITLIGKFYSSMGENNGR